MAVAVVFAVLVAAGIGVVLERENDRQPVAAPGPTTTTAPTSTTPTTEAPSREPPSTTGPPPTAVPSEDLEAVLPDLIRFVEEARGHPFKEEPVVRTASEEEFDARLRDELSQVADALAAEQVTLQGLGLIEPGTDLVEVYESTFEAGVLGFYDPETAELLVQGNEITPYRRTIIVHELTHALDDQYFDLDRPELEERPDESSFGFTAIVEGSARTVENAYRDQLSSDEQADVAREESEIASGFDITTLPIAVILQQQLPYLLGEQLVGRLEDDGGTAAVDDAIARPPTTSEQVVDPDAFEEREPAIEVAAPTADAAVVDEGAIGAVDLELITLLASGDPFDILGGFEGDGVDGWGGGRYVSWAAGGEACARFRVTGDTVEDTDDIQAMLEDWAAEADATITTVPDPAPGAGDRRLIEATRCA